MDFLTQAITAYSSQAQKPSLLPQEA